MITRYDKALILLTVITALILLFFNFISINNAAQGETLFVELIYQEGAQVIPLNQDKTVSVKGPLGETSVEILNGGVQVCLSPCPNHDCVAKGRVSLPGEVIVCAPNNLVVRITGQQTDGIDALNG